MTGFTERLSIHIKLRVTEKDGKLITLNVLTCTKCADNYCSGKNLVASRYILVPLIGIYHHVSHVNYTCTTTIVQINRVHWQLGVGEPERTLLCASLPHLRK